MTSDDAKKSWLTYVNLSDGYEQRARFIPALLTVLFLLPLSAAFSGPLGGWINVVIAGVGLGAVVAIGISHVASLAGNRLQDKLWPRWPHDAPTNQWLHPKLTTRSEQQRAQWREEILILTGLDIDSVVEDCDTEETDRLINDAVTKIRYLLRDSPHADRLRQHNIDYGFARNFTGLRPVWIAFAALSCAGSWIAVRWADGDLLWGVVSSFLLLGSIPLALVLPAYVRVRARHYAESLFSAMSLLAKEGVTHGPPHTDR